MWNIINKYGFHSCENAQPNFRFERTLIPHFSITVECTLIPHFSITVERTLIPHFLLLLSVHSYPIFLLLLSKCRVQLPWQLSVHWWKILKIFLSIFRLSRGKILFEKVLKNCLVSNTIENIFISFFFFGGVRPQGDKNDFFWSLPLWLWWWKCK